MRRHTQLAPTLLVALPFGAAAHAACDPGHIGTSPDCPDYTAPSTTAVPGPSMDGTSVIPPGTTTTLFQGIVPPNGFMVEVHDVNTVCFVSDNNTAGVNIDGKPGGFRIFGPSDANHVEQPDSGLLNGVSGFTPQYTFVTPTGYKPMGAVTIWCPVTTETLINARAW